MSPAHWPRITLLASLALLGVDGAGCTVGVDSPPPVIEAPTVVVRGQVSQTGTGLRLAGVHVCVFGQADVPCVRADDFGRFVLEGVPAHREVMISMESEGHRPIIRMLATGATDPPWLLREWMSPLESALLTARVLGFGSDPSATTVNTWSYAPELSLGYWAGGVRSEVDLPVGATGPYYSDRHGLWGRREDTDRNIGVAGFADLPPGRDIEIRLVSDRMDCILASPWGWPGSTPDRVRVRAVPGYDVNAVNMACEGGARCSFVDDARRTAAPAVMRVENRSTRRLRMVRAGDDCRDVVSELEIIEAGAELEFFSFVGFAYRLYDDDVGDLLRDFYVANRAEPDGEPYLYVYED